MVFLLVHVHDILSLQIMYITGETLCPVTHPYVYGNGRYCCKFDLEKNEMKNETTCDGGPISSSSHCCKDDRYIKCPGSANGKMCKNN